MRKIVGNIRERGGGKGRGRRQGLAKDEGHQEEEKKVVTEKKKSSL